MANYSLPQKSAFLVTDLDGTITGPDGKLSELSIQTLQLANDKNLLIAIATGRNLHSSRKVLNANIPFHYLIFSGGAGVLEWSSQQVLESHALTAKEIEEIAALLMSLDCDFMVQAPVPDNHHFAYWDSGKGNPDFARRREVYWEFAKPLDLSTQRGGSQVIVVEPQSSGGALFERLRSQLAHYAIVRTTSPLDQASIWIEILPRGISKASGAESIRGLHGIPLDRTFAVGNDYNDIDLLRWAPRSFLVENCPEEMRKEFALIPHRHDRGFAAAVALWLQESS